MSTLRVCHDQPARRKLTRAEAALKLSRIAEADMERKGLSETKKNERVRQFIEHVDSVSANRAK
jgi:hypothetical protein